MMTKCIISIFFCMLFFIKFDFWFFGLESEELQDNEGQQFSTQSIITCSKLAVDNYMFLTILQNLQERTCAKGMWIFENIYTFFIEHLPWLLKLNQCKYIKVCLPEFPKWIRNRLHYYCKTCMRIEKSISNDIHIEEAAHLFYKNNFINKLRLKFLQK